MHRLALVLLVACNNAASSSVDGAQLFAANCVTCHGETGKPSEAMVARLNVRDLTGAEFRARVTPQLVEAQLRNGSQNHLMPSFAGMLNDQQIKALAAFVASPAFVKK